MTAGDASDPGRRVADEDLRLALEAMEVRLAGEIRERRHAREALDHLGEPEGRIEAAALPWLLLECKRSRLGPIGLLTLGRLCRGRWLIGRGGAGQLIRIAPTGDGQGGPSALLCPYGAHRDLVGVRREVIDVVLTYLSNRGRAVPEAISKAISEVWMRMGRRGRLTEQAVAVEMSLSTKTLRRHLQASGWTWEEARDAVLQARAS